MANDMWERAAAGANETMRAASRVEELCRKMRRDTTRGCGEMHLQRVCADARDAMQSLEKWTQHTMRAVHEAQRGELKPEKEPRRETWTADEITGLYNVVEIMTHHILGKDAEEGGGA